MNNSKLSVIGLGKLGLCMAGTFAEAGFDVIGVDINPELIDMVNKGEVPYIEPSLEELLANTGSRLKATLDMRQAILDSDTTFIVVATPTLPDGTYSNIQLQSALTSIAEVIANKPKKHNIVVSCTVMPGTLENDAIPLIERVSGKKLGEGFSIAYNPEFIAMGNVIAIFKEPDFVLIGESEPDIGETLEHIYSVMCKNKPPAARMNLINAELAKISLNCYITTKITYANMISEICELLPGANVDVVNGAIGMDARIGGKVLKGGMGYGGPCFPRDNRAFVRLAEAMGMDAGLSKQTDVSNTWQIERLSREVTDHSSRGARVAILGLAYRTDTPLVEESQAVFLAKRLAGDGYDVHVHDPVALDNAKLELGDEVSYHEDKIEALRGADTAVITLMDKEYLALTVSDFEEPMNRGGALVDPWRLYLNHKFTKLNYYPLGVGRAKSN